MQGARRSAGAGRSRQHSQHRRVHMIGKRLESGGILFRRFAGGEQSEIAGVAAIRMNIRLLQHSDGLEIVTCLDKPSLCDGFHNSTPSLTTSRENALPISRKRFHSADVYTSTSSA